MKTVVSIMIDGKQFFRTSPSVCYYSDDLREAKIYNCRAKSKVNEIKNFFEYSNEQSPARVWLKINGKYEGFIDPIILTYADIQTVKLYELVLNIKEIYGKS